MFTYYFQFGLAAIAVSASTTIGVSGSGVAYRHASLRFKGTGIGPLALVIPAVVDFGPLRTGTAMSMPVTIADASESA